MWVELIIVTFLYAVATVDVLMANSNDVNLAKTRHTVYILRDYEIVAPFWLASLQTSFGVRLSRIHFSPTEREMNA